MESVDATSKTNLSTKQDLVNGESGRANVCTLLPTAESRKQTFK